MKKDIALHLGSGGARGYAHIGVIRQLEHQGYNIRFISGSSMGALIGGLYACGKLDEYEKWVTDLDPIDVLKLIDFSFEKTGMMKGEKVFDIISDMIGKQEIQNLKIPFVAIASDIKNHKEYHFSSGSLVEAIRASIAIPTLFTPIIKEDVILVDGGVCNPTGIVTPPENTTLHSIYVDLNGTGEINNDFLIKKSVKNPIQEKIIEFFRSNDIKNDYLDSMGVIQESIDTMQEAIAQIHLQKAKPDTTISIPRSLCRFYDFHRAQEIINYGKQSAAQYF